jgi:hypothetical protein
MSAPGIDLFLSPPNLDAKASGHEYRLDYVRNIARSEGLAVAINATLFGSDSYVIPMVGDFATSLDTVVSSYKINHLEAHDYMLWFDDNLTPHVEKTRPAPLEALKRAKFAIGTKNLAIRGRNPGSINNQKDKRCALGVDPDRRKIWIGMFELASRPHATEVLMRAGAEYVMMLDGGDSASLYLGDRSNGVPHGLRFGGQRAVATVFGVKAYPILDPL